MVSTVHRAGSPSRPTKPSAVRISAAHGQAASASCSAEAAATIRSRGSLGSSGWTIRRGESLSRRSSRSSLSRTWWYSVVVPMPSSAASRRTVSFSQPSRSMSRRAAARISGREVTGGRPVRPGDAEARGTGPAWRPPKPVDRRPPSAYFRNTFQKYTREVPMTLVTPAVDTLRRTFHGAVVEPWAVEYEAARRSLFASGSPAVVLRPTGVRDVQTGVRFAARAGLPLSVRGGGHGFPGFGTNDGGVVLDLRDLADVEVLDDRQHLVRIGGGATWGQVAAALAPHGLAISSGDTKSVGVGGLTLSGGIGWKVRKYGLALDSVVGAELVTADGDVVRADAQENSELFWAIRGGGGNFGVVTALDFAAHRTTDVFFGRITFPAWEAADVLRGW